MGWPHQNSQESVARLPSLLGVKARRYLLSSGASGVTTLCHHSESHCYAVNQALRTVVECWLIAVVVDLGSIPSKGFEVRSENCLGVGLPHRLGESIPRTHALVLSGTLECE